MEIKTLKLNTKLILKMKKQRRMTWVEIAELAGLESRQQAQYYAQGRNPCAGAEYFAKVFKCKPKDLIK